MTETKPATPAVKRGFGLLPCPCCGVKGAMAMDLDDLTGDQAIRCPDCDETFGLVDVRAFIARWEKVLAWIDSAPEVE